MSMSAAQLDESVESVEPATLPLKRSCLLYWPELAPRLGDIQPQSWLPCGPANSTDFEARLWGFLCNNQDRLHLALLHRHLSSRQPTEALPFRVVTRLAHPPRSCRSYGIGEHDNEARLSRVLGSIQLVTPIGNWELQHLDGNYPVHSRSYSHSSHCAVGAICSERCSVFVRLHRANHAQSGCGVPFLD
jgi:hypothetical protein